MAMKRFWFGLSPWLDIPMNQRHWRVLCGFAFASTPLGFGLGQLARQRLDCSEPTRKSEQLQTQAPATSSIERGFLDRTGDVHSDARGGTGGLSLAAMIVVPAGVECYTGSLPNLETSTASFSAVSSIS